MGSVYQRKDGRWVGKFRDVKGSWRYVYRKTKAEAKEALKEAIRDQEEGISPDRLTVTDYLEDWLENQKGVVSVRTLIVKRGNLRVHVYPNLEMKILSPNQVKRLLECCYGDRLEGVYVLGATCGLRIGEALGVKWEEIDFDKGTLTIKRTIWRGESLPTKTNSSRRTIKLPRIALEALLRHREDADRHSQNRIEGSGWVFPTARGNPHYAANFYRHNWKPMLKKAGLPPITYHQLRHGAASFLLSQRVPIPVVSRYLGHANPSITLSVYSHMIDGDEGIAGSAIDSILT
jgi:integrase